MKTKEEKQEIRQKLCELTNHFKAVRKMQAEETGNELDYMLVMSRTLNSYIIEHYRKQAGFGEFDTFAGWKAKNRSVIKGSKGYAIWGKPKQTDEDEPNELFYPISYLFHESQTSI